MDLERIILSEPHLRSLTSTLIIAEGLLMEIRDLHVKDHKTCCVELKNDIDRNIIPQNLKTIDEALEFICNLSEKYSTGKALHSLQRVIDAKRTRIWEVLNNSKSRKMKGYGEFPAKLLKEYDEDIDKLLKISSNLRITPDS